MSDVIVPPYDVITPAEQDRYYEKSPDNYIRVNLNRTPSNEKYTDADQILRQWKKKGILIEESQEVIYLLSQTYSHDGEDVVRVSCICALELRDLGDTVLAHEQIIEEHLNDRYQVLESTQANTGQIFISYQDKEMVLEKIFGQLDDLPCLDVILDEIQYKIWPVSNPELIREFQLSLSDKDLVVLDGHHRYKTAYKYHKRHPEISGSDRIMVTLVNSSDPGMNVLPTHRLLSNINNSLQEIESGLVPNFSVEEMNIESLILHMEDGSAPKGTFGLFYRESNTGLLLNFRNWDQLKKVFNDRSEASQKLDTNILHHFVLNEVFGIDTTNQEKLKNLSYMRGNKPTLELIKEESGFDVACLLQPPSLDEIFSIAHAGETMPQKSTFFFPKIYSGLVTRCFGK